MALLGGVYKSASACLPRRSLPPQKDINEDFKHNRRITTLAGIALSYRDCTAEVGQPTSSQAGCTAQTASVISRRQFGVALAGGTFTLLAQEGKCAEQATNPPSPSSSSSSSTGVLEPFSNTQQGYSMVVPVGWEKKGKAGADVLFEDPARRSSSLGVTVNPVRIPRIEEFGSLETIGQRLLDTERKKESTLGVSMISQQQRTNKGAELTGGRESGATLYDYEYELNSTRGRKRILSTVTIFNSKLYILNGNLKCDKAEVPEGSEAHCLAPPGALEALRASAQSFNITLS